MSPAPKRGRGRPKGTGAPLVRTAVMRVRLTPEQRARYDAASAALGVTLTDWVCEACEAFARDERVARE